MHYTLFLTVIVVLVIQNQILAEFDGIGLLKYRLISAFILMPIVIMVLFLLTLSEFTILAMAICVLAIWEWGKLSGFVSCTQRIYLVVFFSLLLLTMILVFPQHHYNIHQPIVASFLWTTLSWWSIALLLVFFYPRSAKIWCNSKLLRLIFGLLTILPFFWGMLVLRAWHYEDNKYIGSLYLLYVMNLVWGADSGSYMFGKLFGKHKLAPKISPEKTWQGFIGGLFTASIISLGYSVWSNLNIAPTKLIICSILSVLASVLGDLTESMFKREAKIKDSGHLIPGHGGMLDRIDSLSAAVPVFVSLLFLVFKTI